jgi:glycosyltransferase involved in cell wall biosynthesis
MDYQVASIKDAGKYLINLALYNGGIAHWFRPLLLDWVACEQHRNNFFFLYPASPELKKIALDGGCHVSVRWPSYFPRNLRHPYYDNWQFTLALKKIKPQFLLSPYHDVRLPPKSSSLYTVISIHDLCFLDQPKSYPLFVRLYYLYMLRRNISRAHHILTISESTKFRLIKEFNLPEGVISVVTNSLEAQFLDSTPSQEAIFQWRKQHLGSDVKIALYSGGIEYRKNIERLLSAFRKLWKRGYQISLFITGQLDSRRQQLFSDEELRSGKIKLLGFLTPPELRLAYAAANCVVFPSLCEGFGRSCIEAMVAGTPLACSNLPVFYEVAGDYPNYFDPLDVNAIANAILLSIGSSTKVPCNDSSYRWEVAQKQFTHIMKRLMDEARLLSSAGF